MPDVRAGVRVGLATHSDVVFGKVDTEAEQELAAAAGITLDPDADGLPRRESWSTPSPGALPAPALEQVIAGGARPRHGRGPRRIAAQKGDPQ